MNLDLSCTYTWNISCMEAFQCSLDGKQVHFTAHVLYEVLGNSLLPDFSLV